MKRSRLVRATVSLGLAVGAVLVVAQPASAHVRVEGEIAPGGNGTFTFTVPNESETANTIKVEIKIPDDAPLGSLRTEVTPGWTATTTTRALDEPIEVFGSEVTEVIDVVTFTAETGGGIPPGQFARFNLRGGPFPEDVEQVIFPTIQTYDDGEVASWIEEPVEGQPEPESPAPVLVLSVAADETSDHGDAGDGTDEESTDQPAAETDDDDGTDALTIVALVVAIVAAGVAALALASARRARV
jgi:periplasmic copper chaperone A